LRFSLARAFYTLTHLYWRLMHSIMKNDLPKLSNSVRSQVSDFLADLVTRPPNIIKDIDEREENEYHHHERLYDAYELLPHRPDECAKVSMDVARQCNGCVDAVTHLTQLARLSPEKALPCYEWATKAGREFLGDEFFQEPDGRMWGDISARPYMRALFGKGDTLWDLGRADDADACFTELLKLEKQDIFDVAPRISVKSFAPGDFRSDKGISPERAVSDDLPGPTGVVNPSDNPAGTDLHR